MDVGPYTAAIAACFPQVSIDTALPVLEGWDSIVLEINGELIFRFPRRPEVYAQLEKECQLLPVLAEELPLDIPRFEYVSPDDGACGKRFVGYRKINGVSLAVEKPTPVAQIRLARQLARFLTTLHRFPLQRAVGLGVPGSTALAWRQDYENLYGQLRRQVFPLLRPPLQVKAERLWEGFLADDGNFSFPPALVHGDLGSEHILWDSARGEIAGVIDWGDARIGDPALDFVGLLYDLGPEFTHLVLDGYEGVVDRTFGQRMVFYVKIIPYYEILYGLGAGGEAHLRRGLRALESDLSA